MPNRKSAVTSAFITLARFDDVDVLLCPATMIAAHPLAEAMSEIATYSRLNLSYLRNTAIGNILNLCGLSVPCGTTGDGLPVGLMVYARPFGERFAGRTTLMANMVEGGRTPMLPADRLAELGFEFVIFPGGMIRALVLAGQDYLASLKEHGTTAPFRDRMLDFDALNRILGLDEVLAAGARYEPGED